MSVFPENTQVRLSCLKGLQFNTMVIAQAAFYTPYALLQKLILQTMLSIINVNRRTVLFVGC